jgi:hypothetical protein
VEKKRDLRRHPRTRVEGGVQLSWTDQYGEQRFMTGRIIDVSETGMRIQTRERLVKLAYVSLRADQIALQGTASVRSCARQGSAYVVGLEFSGGLKWKPNQPYPH